MGHAAAGHQAHQVGEIIPEGRGDHAVRHDVLYLHGPNCFAVLRKRTYNITFGDNTENGVAARHHQNADVLCAYQSAALLMLASGAIVTTSVPFFPRCFQLSWPYLLYAQRDGFGAVP